uniref:Uncharacterized protein n=1 Tax=Rhizophora mucronata TaxID=61149 RepID=A0A2P2QSQ5_RHIMU
MCLKEISVSMSICIFPCFFVYERHLVPLPGVFMFCNSHRYLRGC